jgi:hypothetical protein
MLAQPRVLQGKKLLLILAFTQDLDYSESNHLRRVCVMESLNKLEDWLAGIYKSTPKLSDSSKKSIVKAWPWVAVVLGVLQAWGAYALWHWGHEVNKVIDTFNSYFGTTLAGVHKLSVAYWISLVIVIVVAVLLLAAYPGLVKRTKAGWNFLFYAALVNVVYGVFSAFNDYGSVGTLIGQVIGSAILLYFLFQIRDQYSVGKKATPVE